MDGRQSVSSTPPTPPALETRPQRSSCVEVSAAAVNFLQSVAKRHFQFHFRLYAVVGPF